MATEILVPIRLKVLLDSISEFLKILDNLLPNTNNWKALNKIISSMVTESLKLQALISTPFSSGKLFTLTERTIDKLEEAAARVLVVMLSLKFSDIKLTPALENLFKLFETEINNIRLSYTKLLDETKQKLLSNDNNKLLIGNIDSKNLEKDFSGIETAVDAHIRKLESLILERNAKLAELRSDKALGESASKLITEGMSADSIGADIFNKYLRKTKNGELTMNFGDKGVSKKALLNAIGEMYHLEPGELLKTIEQSLGKSLLLINAEEINSVFKKMGKNGIFSGIISKGKSSNGKLALLNGELAGLEALLKEYALLLSDILKLSSDVNLGKASSDANNLIAAMQLRADLLRTSIVLGMAANNSYTASLNLMKSQFPLLRSILESTNAQFLKMLLVLNTFNSLKTTIANFMGFTLVLNLTKRAIKEAANHIKELDSVMNKISIVTNMDTSDLWELIDQYSAMAQKYGTTIKGAYEVSLIYYQQGLETADVLTLTNETLKLAKISGLDYASTTDYMTTAIRGFKMEMSEAATVVDVYSALAANTAVSQEELAVAMSKTASSMESVGSTFQETSAMIATMVAVTRESATNIGSAMKSIGSRYGELTKDPSKLVDSEGEAMSFNKVDAALLSVGISMKTAEGQFREFTDVIIELGEKWNELESTQLRYIATQFAGNRQLSRFLALVSNVDLLKANIDVAENSEDIGTVLALKSLDSLESKIELTRVAYLLFYTTIGVENVWKSFLDGTKNVINTLNGMPKVFNKIPLGAINAIAQLVVLFKNLAFSGLAKIANLLGLNLVSGIVNSIPAATLAGADWAKGLFLGIESLLGQAKLVGQTMATYVENGFLAGRTIKSKNLSLFLNWQNMLSADNSMATRVDIGNAMKAGGFINHAGFEYFTASAENANEMMNVFSGTALMARQAIDKLGSGIISAGLAFSMLSLMINTSTAGGKILSGAFTTITGTIIGVGAAIQAVNSEFLTIPWYAIASAIVSIFTGISLVIEANSPAEKLEEATKKAEDLSNKAKLLKADYKTLDTTVKKYKELELARYDSAEASQAYLEAVDKIVEAYPQLLLMYDENNEAVLNASLMEETLTQARDASAEATLRAALAEAEKAKAQLAVDKKAIYTSNDKIQNASGKMDITWFKGVDRDKFMNIYGTELNELGLAYLDLFLDEFNALEKAIEAELPDIEAAIAAISHIRNLSLESGWLLDTGLDEILNGITEAINNYLSDEKIIQASNIATVSAWMNNKYLTGGQESIFKDNSGIMKAAKAALYDSMKSSDDFSNENIATYANSLFADINKIYFGDENRRKQLNEFLSNSDLYTIGDFTKTFEELKDTTWLTSIFTQQALDSKTLLEGKIDQLRTNLLLADEGKLLKEFALSEDLIKKFDDYIIDELPMSVNLLKLMTKGINQSVSLKKLGLDPELFITQFLDFYKNVYRLPADLRNLLIELFETNGFTNEGLLETKNWIDNNDEIQAIPDINFDSIKGMMESFIPNLALTISTMTDSLEENIDKIESSFSGFSSGISGTKLLKAIASANELGLKVSRSDFFENGDKFFLKYEKYSDVIADFDKIYSDKFNETESQLDNAKKSLDKNLNDSDSAKLILGAEYDLYYDKLGNIINSEGLKDAIGKAYDDRIQELHDYLNFVTMIKDHLTKSNLWRQGDYTSLTHISELQLITDDEGNLLNYYKDKDSAYKRIQLLAADSSLYTAAELALPETINAVENYLNGLKALITDLSTYGADYLSERTESYAGVSAETVAEILALAASGTNGVVNAIRKYGHDTGMTISEINNAIIEAIAPGRAKALTNMIGKSVTLSDLAKYAETYKIGEGKVELFLTEDHKLGGELGKLYDLDALTGELKLKSTSTTFDLVLAAYKTDLQLEENITGDLRELLYQAWIASIVSKDDLDDAGKQMAAVISSLSSAKAGTRVDLSKSPEIEKQLEKILGKELNGFYKITSELERDNLILALEGIDEGSTTILNDLKRTIRAKRNKGKTLLGISGTSFTREDLVSYFAARGLDVKNYDDKNLNWWAERQGYTYDEMLDLYIATLEAINSIDELIAKENEKDKPSTEYLKQLYEKRAQLVDKFSNKEQKNALTNLLEHYDDAGEYINDFNTAFFTNLEEEGIVTTIEGKQVVDVEKLKAFDKIDETFDEIFTNHINQLADSYISNMQLAGSLVTQGTTSKTEMDAFLKAYEEIMGKDSIANFIYDEITHTMVLNPAQLRSYLARIAANSELGLTPKQLKDWVNSLIEALTIDNLDFSKILDGSATKKDKDTLIRNLKQHFKLNASKLGYRPNLESLENWAINMVNNTMAGLAEGGQVAIDAIKSTGKELSTEEIKSAYRAQVAPLAELASTLSSLEKGSVVASNLIQALRKAGFEVSADGVVTSTGDLVEAYRSIYDDMKATNEATVSELNGIVGNILDNRDKQLGAIDALSNAANMTYSSFVEIFTKAGIEITESMIDAFEYDGIIQSLGGDKMMITNFSKLAEIMSTLGKWDIGSDEYTQAFKQYNESIIELDRKTLKNIKSELDSILSASAGDKLDISWITKGLSDKAKDIVTEYGATLNDTTLKITNATDIAGMVLALIDTLLNAGEDNIKLVDSEIAELQDSIKALIEGVIGQIRNGISGTLSNTDASKLKLWATSHGIGDLDFTETAEGLKLTESSMFALYASTKKMNRYLARNLLPDMMKMSNRYSDLISATKEFNDTLKEASYNEANRNKLTGLADIIKSALLNPDTYNLMSLPLPTEWQIAKNFYESALNGMNILASAAKNGFMGVEDFYSIVHTASSLNPNFSVGGLNGDLLLDSAAEHLLIVNGKLLVNLKKAGIKSSKDFKEFREGWLEGLEFLRKTESGYLELNDRLSMIHDTINKIEPIKPSLIFDEDGFSKKAKTWFTNINTLLGNEFTKGFSINGVSLLSLLAGEVEDWIKAGFSTDNGNLDKAAVTSFIQGLSSIDFNSDEIVLQFEDLFSKDKLLVSFPVKDGFITIKPTGEVLTIDLSDKKILNNLKKHLGTSKKDEITKQVEQALATYTDKETTLEGKIKARVTIGIATGEIDYSNIKRGKDGKWSGLFNGHTITAGKAEDVATKMGQILTALDLGWSTDSETFEIDDKTGNTHVIVKKKFGGITVKWDVENNVYYDPQGKPYKDYQDMVETLIKSGNFDEEWKPVEVEGDGVYTVKYNKSLGIYYTLHKKDDDSYEYIYDSQNFNSMNELRKYIALKEKFEDTTGETAEVKEGEVTIGINKDAKIILRVEDGKVKKVFSFNEKEFDGLSDEAFDAFVEASKQEGVDFTKNVNGESVATYEVDGAVYTITYNGDGELTLTCALPNGGGTITAHSWEELQRAISAYNLIQGKESGNNSSGGYTLEDITIDGEEGKFTIIVDGNGKVVVTDEEGNINEELSKKYTELLKGTTVPVDGSGAKAEVSGVAETILGTIDGIDGTVTIKIDAKTAVSSLLAFKTWFNNSIVKPLTKAIEIAIDSSEASGTLDTLKADIQNLSTQGEGEEDTRPKIDLNIDLAKNTLKELDGLIKGIALGDSSGGNSGGIPINVNIVGAMTLINNLTVAINGIKLKDNKPLIDVDTSPGNEKVTALKAAIDALKQDSDKIPKIDVDTDDAIEKLNAVIEKIGEVLGKTVYIDIVTRHHGCFVAGTKIYMADGTVRNIEDIYLDDVVMAYNPQTNEFVPKKVIDGYTHHNTIRIVEVTFSDGTILKMTPSHPILTTKGWRSLDPIISLDEHGILPEWLEIGDLVISYNGKVQITDIQELSVPKNFDTYDFEVEDCHTFLAEGIPVHNAMITGPAATFGKDNNKPTYTKAKGSPTWLNPMGGSASAKGTAGPARGAGHRTETLMGELGPEMFVSGNRYHIVGTSGAEFVNLPDDAIVFNHLQTRRLLAHGVGGHGTPVTNERNAIAFVKGTGPAAANPMVTPTPLVITPRRRRVGSSGGNSEDAKKAISAISQLINDVINKGFEYINLDDYEDLPAEVRAIAEKHIADGSYRDFVKEVAEYSDQTVREINELYMLAYLKELKALSKAVNDSLKNMKIYSSNNSMLMSEDDLLELFGDNDTLIYAIENGIVEYNDLLDAYVVRSWQDLITLVPDILNNPHILVYYEDAIRNADKEWDELLSNALGEGLNSVDRAKFLEAAKRKGYDVESFEWTWNDEGLWEFTNAKDYWQFLKDNYEEMNELVSRWQEGAEKTTRGVFDAFRSGVTWDAFHNNYRASLDTIVEIFNKAGVALSKEWLNSLERDSEGNYIFTSDLLAKAGVVLPSDMESEIKEYLDELSLAQEEQISSDVGDIITTFIDQGFDAIDWRKYHDLPAEIRDLIKNSAELSRRDFVTLMANATNKTVNEINELYFKAWEADLALDKLDSTKSMQFYANGGMSGSSSDWTKLLGNTVKVSDLVAAGLLEYNEVLGTYYSNNWAAILELTGIEIDPSVIADSIREAFKTIGEKIKDGLSGTLSNVDADLFKETLRLMGLGDIQLKFELGLEGLKLSQESAISLYLELKKINSILAELTFKELNESLKESNDHYKTTLSVMMRIVELQKKIDEADKNVSDARLKMYKEELLVAKEILQIRATSEDESFNFLDREIPGAMNNPLNYVNNWITGWKELRDAANNNTPMDFAHMYNIINEINNAAGMAGEAVNFFGYTLSGSLQDADAAILGAIDALGSDTTGAYGVMLSNFGDGLTSGVDSYANSADAALHLMAKVQMKVLDALIQMFEAIVAMEEFDGVDINMDGLLDLGEVFLDATEKADKAILFTDEFTLAALNLKDKIDNNSELKTALESVKIGGYSLKQLIEDAADGVRDLPLSADLFASAFSLLYSALKNGDFDLNNIAESLKQQLALHPGSFSGTLEYGDFILNLTYNVLLKKNEKGEYVTPGGQTYTNVDDAVHAAALELIGADGEKVTVDPVTHIATGSIEISNTEVKVEAKPSGIYYTVGDGKAVGTKEEAIYAVFQQETGGEGDFNVWKLEKGITARMTIDKVDVSNITPELVRNALGTTWKDIKEEWESGKNEKGENLTFEAKYGVSLNDFTTEADWENFKLLIGVESKNVEINAIVNKGSEESGLITAIETGKVDITLTLMVEETLNLSEEISDGTVLVNADVSQAKTEVDTFTNETNLTSSTVTVDSDTTEGEQKAEALKNMIAALRAIITVEANDKASSVIQSIIDLLHSMPSSKTVTITTVEKKVTEDSGETQAKGNAMARGTKTLMGELGPELYVTNGRYYVAGQNGAEFVNLPDDAIVFNHLQTKKLLESGNSGRGHAVTTEERAVAYARGSLGPAAADARLTLATLKQIRAMWAKLAEASIADLAGINGGVEGIGPWLAEVERWYNLLQKIALLEKEITYQEALRNKIESDRNANGQAYYAAQKALLANHMEEANAYRELAESLLAFFDQRRQELNERSAPLAKLYKFDESGLLKFEEGAYAFLSGLFEPDDYGRPKYTAQQLYAILTNSPFGDFSRYMEYDSSGNKIERDESDTTGDLYARDRVQAFWERIEAERTEMLELHDSIEDAKVKFLEAETEGNKLLQEIVDNLLKVEDSILAAIEDREQAIIDSLLDEKELLLKNNQAYIEGLRNALNKEREMYQLNESLNDLTRLLRRLAILLRSGGSATEIRSLQDLIRDKLLDMYFDIQEKEINSINEAADALMKRLDTLIQLLTDTLEFEKEHGLLWTEALNIMNGTTSSILSFLITNTADWQSKSALGQAEELRQMRFLVDLWTAYRDDFDTTIFDTKTAMAEGFDAVANANYSPLDYSDAMANSEEWRAAITAAMDAALAKAGGGISGSGSGGKKKSGSNSNYSGVSAWDKSGPSKYDKLPDDVKQSALAKVQEETTSLSQPSLQESDVLQTNSDLADELNKELQRLNDYLSWLLQLRTQFNGLSWDNLNAQQRDYLIFLDELIKWASNNIATLKNNPTAYDWEEAFKEHKPSTTEQQTEAAYVKIELEKFKKAWEAIGGIPTDELLEADPVLKKYFQEYLIIKDKYDLYDKLNFYKEGGLADYTGLAMVHGTKTRPEAFLNAKLTQMWKLKVLGSDSSSLTSRLLELNNILAGIERASSYIGETGDGGIIIEKAEVNVNVQELANSYDARQAGQDIMNEIVQIARKSGAGTSIRR